MKRRSVAGAASLAVCAVAAITTQRLITTVRAESNIAESFWEEAIDARGGRRPVIENAVLAERFGRAEKLTSVTLLVPPGRVWYWTSDLAPRVRPFMAAFDLGSNSNCLIQTGQQQASVLSGVDDWSFKMTALLLLHFMETKTLKPVPVSYRTETISTRKMNVVRVRTEVTEAEFWFGQNHLPQRITFPGHTLPVFDIKTYHTIQGLQLPERVTENWLGRPWQFRYDQQINVSYDPDVFNCPPRWDRGPNAWRRASAPSERP